MDLDRERKIADLCSKAMDLPLSEVKSWLTHETEGDPSLFEEVLEYLELMDSGESGSFLGRAVPPMEAPTDWSEDAMKDQLVGPYLIKAKLGEGGMGSVFLALQTAPVTRQVALKLVRRPLSAKKKRSVTAEVQAMALLSHPNIAQIFDAGSTEDGHLYFAMEYVQGEAITRYCDRKKLDLNRRMWLLFHVCRGVQHAHREGILHRDLKPSNILVCEVDGQPVPKIIDFGTALTHHRPEFEDLSFLEAGTPMYMSPEAMYMAGRPGDVDMRTDVYALGVVLFELLTGFQPFSTENMQLTQIMQQVVDQDAPRPSERFAEADPHQKEEQAANRGTVPQRLMRQLKGDLDWITAKSLTRDRDLRYHSAASLAADLEASLKNEYVAAAPSSPRRAFMKLLNRNAYLLTSTILASALIAMGLYLGRIHDPDRGQVREETTLVTEFTAELLQSMEAETVNRPGLTVLNRTMTQIEERYKDQPLTAAALFNASSILYGHMSQYELALQYQKKYLEIISDRKQADHPDIAQSFIILAGLHLKLLQLEEAERFLGKAEAAFSDQPLAQLWETRGGILTAKGEYQAAETLFRKGLTAGRDQRNTEWIAQFQHLLAKNLHAQGLYEAAKEMQEQAAIYMEKTALLHQRLQSLRWSSRILTDLGSYGEATIYLKKAIELCARERDPKHPEAALNLLYLGQLKIRKGDWKSAQQELQKSAALLEPYKASHREALAEIYLELHHIQRLEGQWSEAENYLKQAGIVFNPGERHALGGRILHERGKLAAARGDHEKAIEIFYEELAFWETYLPRHPAPILCLGEIAFLHHKGGRKLEAQHALNKALRLKDGIDAPQWPNHMRVLEIQREINKH